MGRDEQLTPPLEFGPRLARTVGLRLEMQFGSEDTEAKRAEIVREAIVTHPAQMAWRIARGLERIYHGNEQIYRLFAEKDV